MTTISSNIHHAVKLLKAGGLVAFPTETVYGLGADASNDNAIHKVFQAKNRPFNHPLIVHLAEINQLPDWADTIPAPAFALADAFWPGPLTLILKKKSSVLESLTGGQDTIGLRIPCHPIAQALLQTFRKGIAAPSANQFTHVSPTTAEAVKEELDGKIDLILEGGPCAVGLESTILDLSKDEPIILRPGMITAHALEKVLRTPVFMANQKNHITRAPGHHPLHYAPLTQTTLLETAEIPSFLQTLATHEFPIALITYHDLDTPHHPLIHCIKMPKNAALYAHDLYKTLRLLDHQHFKHIFIEAVPHEAEWDAIRDRISKATGRSFKNFFANL